MKAKCEELVIERYLKGDIGNKFKDELLWVVNLRRHHGQYLEILSKLLQDESSEKLNVLETIVEMTKKQMMDDDRHFPPRNKKFVNELLAELENETFY